MIEKLDLPEERKIESFNLSSGHAQYTAPAKTPFIIILHSLGKNEKQSIKLSNVLPKNAYVLAVRAPIKWIVDGEESFAWFDIKGPMIEQFCKEDDILTSIEYLKQVIEDFKKEITNLDEPIILGFSQGGIVALTMAVEKIYPLKGVFCHCGFYENKLNTNQSDIETNILMTNGENDYIIPKVWAEQSYDILVQKCKNFDLKFLNHDHEINETVLEILNEWLKKIL